MKIQQVFAWVVAGLLISGCAKSSSGSGGAAATSVQKKSAYDVNKYALNNIVCNPLGGGSASSSDPSQGIQAKLWYLSANQPRYSDVEDVINNGVTSTENLFFSELYVPTRLFTEGFPLQSGGSINDDSGNLLIEYFALRFDTVLHLGPNDVEGDYQLGILSDDGTVWSLATDENEAGLQPVLTNDGVHPTQMGCGPVVHMTSSTRLAMRLDYFQGPRYHIALVPMWRLVNSCPAPTEPLCGQNGNSLYFDYNNNSEPEPAFNQLISRGWTPLGVGNYSIPMDAVYNPCTQGTTPVISNFSVVFDSESNGFIATWTTDIPATDQLLITDQATGKQQLTTSTNFLNTNHVVILPALTSGHSYEVQAVSVSGDLGSAISTAVLVTAP